MPIVVVTGTDTNVGKTFVTSSLTEILSSRGVESIAIKPVETGYVREDSDALKLFTASGEKGLAEPIYRFDAPLAPAMAAEIEGVTIDLRKIQSRIKEFSRPNRVLLVEGAGGALVPITWTSNILDLAKSLNARVLVVARNALGTINHSLLTRRAIAQYELESLGIILSQSASTVDQSAATNQLALTKLMDHESILELPYIHSAQDANVGRMADWFLRRLNLI